jgi:hypothetical protein
VDVGGLGVEAGSLEGAGRLSQLVACAVGGGLGDGVEDFAEADEAVGGGCVVVLVEGVEGLSEGADAGATGASWTAGSRIAGGPVGVRDAGGEALADAGEREIGGELGPGEPDGLVVAVAVVGQGDAVADDVARGCDARLDPDALRGEPMEELLLGRGSGEGAVDVLAQLVTDGAFKAAAGSLEVLGAGRPFRGGAVAGVELA